jgi:hypothetical protein
MSLFTQRCMRRRKKRENFESLRSLSYSMQDISLQPPASDSLQSLSINSLQPLASHSLQSLAANSLQPPASHSLQSLSVNSLQPLASHSLQFLGPNSLHSLQPPASHSLQSLAINCRQSPDGQSLQTPVVNSFLVGLSTLPGSLSPKCARTGTTSLSRGGLSPAFACTCTGTTSVSRDSISPTFARTGTTSVSRGSLEPASRTGTADISMPPDTLEVRPFSGAPSIRMPEGIPASYAYDPVLNTGTPGDSSVSYAPVFPTGAPEANPERTTGTGTSSAAGRRNNSDVWSSTTDGKTKNDEPDDQQGSSKTKQTHQTSCSDGVLTIAIGQDNGGGAGSDEEATRTSKGGAGFVVHTDSFFGRDLSRLKIALSNHRDVIRPRNVKKRSRKL